MNCYKKFIVDEGMKVNLKHIDSNPPKGSIDEAELEKLITKNTEKLFKLQYRLYAENKQSLLIVLQAMDAGGKDGVINRVLAPMNPQGTRCCSFKTPSGEEASHDFLWRVHNKAPAKGEVVIFNRSHYEDVLITRVHNLVPKKVWKKRYELINNFEEMLSLHDTRILKFYLHISSDEQLRRFGDRLNEKDKHWKISESDYSERNYWDDYMEAFNDAISKCSKKTAPWFVIPSNNKKFRDYAISEIIIKTFESMHMKIPDAKINPAEIRKIYEADLKKEKKEKRKRS